MANYTKVTRKFYKCHTCGKEHSSLSHANRCHPAVIEIGEKYGCPECDLAHATQEAAALCCVDRIELRFAYECKSCGLMYQCRDSACGCCSNVKEMVEETFIEVGG